jgi:hypothetical protein
MWKKRKRGCETILAHQIAGGWVISFTIVVNARADVSGILNSVPSYSFF